MRIPGIKGAKEALLTLKAVRNYGVRGTRRLAQITSPEEHRVHTDWKGKEYEGQPTTPLKEVMENANRQV